MFIGRARARTKIKQQYNVLFLKNTSLLCVIGVDLVFANKQINVNGRGKTGVVTKRIQTVMPNIFVSGFTFNKE